MKKLFSLIIVALLMGLTHQLYAQTAVIKVVAVTPRDIATGVIDTAKYKATSSGLKVVGKGELVYLMGSEAGGEEVTNYAWTLTKPTGSAAGLDITDPAFVTFRPDVADTFRVGLTITTATGTKSTSVKITSALWVGVGVVGGQSPDFAKGQCGGCHAGNTVEWMETGHSELFELGIDGIASSHYGPNCISCHTVGYNKDAQAVNNGFDDVMTTVGWIWPDSLVPGNFAALNTSFPDLADLANIQCENCHGPGSLHKGDKTKTAVTLDDGMCGKCHDSGSHHIKTYQWRRSGHAIGVASAAGRSGCADCHSGWGFIKLVDPASDLDLTTGFEQVSCAVCHDPHSNELPHQVRTMADVTLGNGFVVNKGGFGKLCMNCHKGRRDAEVYAQQYASHFGPHYSNQADMLFGQNAVQFGMYIPSSTHRDALEDGCVSCHMYETPGSGAGQDNVGEHTFAMHFDNGTPADPSDDVDNVESCLRCHGELESFEDIMAREDYDMDGTKESCIAELDGLMEEVGKLLPPLGDPAVTIASSYNKIQLKAAFNYQFVYSDHSHGMHNFQYAINLLKISYAALNYGVLSPGAIQYVADVPNDQGKQVEINWTRFGGDGISDNPVKFYSLWRRSENMGKTTNREYSSITSIPADLTVLNKGVSLIQNGIIWTFVGSAPAAAMMQYSAVVPTLFDSTAAGIHWSHFFVLGQTANPALTTASAPDSGYSIDNLAPAPPSGLAAAPQADAILLQWDDPIDVDFKYFAIYRSTDPDFNPANVDPIATKTETEFLDTGVEAGIVYYYQISAYDFSGNQSQYSNKVNAVITSITSQSGIPEAYALRQNYPNPFNPATQVTFELPEAAYVKISIYDAVGNEVAVPVNNNMNAGYYTFTWNANNFASGVYFYKMETAKYIKVHKMLLLK